jgi:hypothetical protein
MLPPRPGSFRFGRGVANAPEIKGLWKAPRRGWRSRDFWRRKNLGNRPGGSDRRRDGSFRSETETPNAAFQADPVSAARSAASLEPFGPFARDLFEGGVELDEHVPPLLAERPSDAVDHRAFEVGVADALPQLVGERDEELFE